MEPKGYNTVTGFTQTSSSVASFTYDLANGTGDNRWAGALISLGSGFNLAANDLVISGSDAGSSYYKVVLEDAEGDKVTVRVNVDGRVSLTQSMVDSVGNASFNATDVRYVSIVVDDPDATTGTRIRNHDRWIEYVPVIAATTTSALTILPVGSSIIDMERHRVITR